MSKTNEQLIQDQLDRMISVGEVIELLKQYPSEAKFGVHGHFGDFNGMSKSDFTFTTGDLPNLQNYVTADYSLRDHNRKYIPAVLINAPDIGPDPD